MSAFAVLRHSGPRAFLDRAEPWLMRREEEHSLILGLAADRARVAGDREDAPYLATVERAGRVVGCALRTPPHKLVVTRLPREAASALVADLASAYDALPAVLGPVDAAQAVAESWRRVRRVSSVPGMRQRIYAVRRVRPPPAPPPGAMRPARPEDLSLITPWMRSFLAATGMPGRSAGPLARNLVERGELALWEDGAPVAMTGFSARTRNTVRVGYVFTPEARRRRGYGTALVAQASLQVLESGCRSAVLYADLANAAANRIYRSLGYRPVQDAMDVEFRPW